MKHQRNFLDSSHGFFDYYTTQSLETGKQSITVLNKPDSVHVSSRPYKQELCEASKIMLAKDEAERKRRKENELTNKSRQQSSQVRKLSAA